MNTLSTSQLTHVSGGSISTEQWVVFMENYAALLTHATICGEMLGAVAYELAHDHELGPMVYSMPEGTPNPDQV